MQKYNQRFSFTELLEQQNMLLKIFFAFFFFSLTVHLCSPGPPPVAPLSSTVKVFNQDCDAPSPECEEPTTVADQSRPRPSTVTVIHTGTKWRQVPREVSWETTELWDRTEPSEVSSF